MSNPPEKNKRTEQWNNLARLYRLPDAAEQDRTGWSRRHFDAVVLPADLFERALVGMLGGWLLYADAHQRAYASSIGDDAVLGQEWAVIGAGLLGLLNGHLGRLDGGTLDNVLRDTLHANGINLEDL
jgi:hypothetical protein